MYYEAFPDLAHWAVNEVKFLPWCVIKREQDGRVGTKPTKAAVFQGPEAERDAKAHAVTLNNREGNDNG